MLLNENIYSKLNKSSAVVVLTGAGVSKESGVPTFRDADGLWSKYRPEDLANYQAFLSNPDLVWEWYQYRRSITRSVSPNSGHKALVAMEDFFENFTLITQNVDDLHRRAGSRNILELHGNIEKNYCIKCGKRYDMEFDLDLKSVQNCECGAHIRPDIVWFGEMLPSNIIQAAESSSRSADLFISVGTSSLVYPAAGLAHLAAQQGAIIIEINPDETPLTSVAELFLQGKSGDILPKLFQEMKQYLSN